MPNRIIKESIKTSNEIDRLSWFEEVLFYRLMVSADDFGRYDGRAKILKNTLFPTKDDVTVKNVEKALCTLEETGLVHAYKVEGVPILQILKWEKHQRIRNKTSKYPSPDEADAVDGQLTADCGQVTADCGLNPIQSNTIQSESNISIRHKYGEYKNVLLSDDDVVKLKEEFPTDWKERIENLSRYIESKGAKYKNHLATIRNWARMDKQRKTVNGNGGDVDLMKLEDEKWYGKGALA